LLCFFFCLASIMSFMFAPDFVSTNFVISIS
jgi:hypothetical protein